MNVASFVRLAASIAWVAFIGVIVIAVARAARGKPVRALTTVIIVLGIGRCSCRLLGQVWST